MSAENSLPMDSELARERIQLYLYDELSHQERLEIERIRDEDPAFRALFEDERKFLVSLGERESADASEALLAECRHNLMRAVYLEEMDRRKYPVASRARLWWKELAAGFTPSRLAWRAAPALALVACGFFLGRMEPARPEAAAQPALAGIAAGPAEIQSVQVDPNLGEVRIVFEERRVISGTPADPRIRGLLLSTVRESHSGARLASLEALRSHAKNQEIRKALLRSMLEDENPGVRFKALEVVRLEHEDPEVRQALVQTVLRDPNAGMRVQAIQLLTANPDRGLVGALQNIAEQEQNPYVQQQVERALQDLGASVEYH